MYAMFKTQYVFCIRATWRGIPCLDARSDDDTGDGIFTITIRSSLYTIWLWLFLCTCFGDLADIEYFFWKYLHYISSKLTVCFK